MQDGQRDKRQWLPLSFRGLLDAPQIAREAAGTVLFLLGVLMVICAPILLVGLLWRIFEALFWNNNQLVVWQLSIAMAALIGAPFAIWRVITAAQQVRVNQEVHHADVFMKALEKLAANLPDGTPDIQLRVAGVYALERLAVANNTYHISVMEVLSRFLRDTGPKPENWSDQADKEEVVSWVYSLSEPTADREAAMAAICRRTNAGREIELATGFKIDFSQANLQRMTIGNTVFNQADFSDASLEGCRFHAVTFDQCTFSGCRTTGTAFSNCRMISPDFSWGTISHADFLSTTFENGQFFVASFVENKFYSVDFGTSDLRGVDMSDCKFHGTTEFSRTIATHSTKLPEEVARPKHWPKFSDRDKGFFAGAAGQLPT